MVSSSDMPHPLEPGLYKKVLSSGPVDPKWAGDISVGTEASICAAFTPSVWWSN